MIFRSEIVKFVRSLVTCYGDYVNALIGQIIKENGIKENGIKENGIKVHELV